MPPTEVAFFYPPGFIPCQAQSAAARERTQVDIPGLAHVETPRKNPPGHTCPERASSLPRHEMMYLLEAFQFPFQAGQCLGACFLTSFAKTYLIIVT